MKDSIEVVIRINGKKYAGKITIDEWLKKGFTYEGMAKYAKANIVQTLKEHRKDVI